MLATLLQSGMVAGEGWRSTRAGPRRSKEFSSVPSPAIVFGNVQVDLDPAPIRPAWVREGNPVARNAVLAKSRDLTATTLVWDCTAGSFEWFYDTDETIHVVEGSVLLRQDGGPARRIGPGDVVFFPAGSSAHWQVEGYVRKLAFFRHPAPKPVEWALRALGWVKATLRPRKRGSSGQLGPATAPPRELHARPPAPALRSLDSIGL